MSSRTLSFQRAYSLLAKQIAQSKSAEDPAHATNTMHWMLVLEPTADEVLQLAAFGHDVERSLIDRHRADMFDTYEGYKAAHSKRSGEVVSTMLQQAGYTKRDGERAANIIAKGEFTSDEPEAQLLCDADSISFFDNNAPYYIATQGTEIAKHKMQFMYARASERAQKHIREVLLTRPELNLLGLV